MKFGLLLIALIACIGGSGCADKRETTGLPSVEELAAEYAVAGYDVSEERIKADLARIEKYLEAESVKEKKRKLTRVFLLSNATVGFLWLFAKYLSVGSRKKWYGQAADVLLTLFGLLVAAHMAVDIHCDMVLGRTGVMSSSGHSVVLREGDPLGFYGVLSVYAAVAVFIAYLSLRKFFRKKQRIG